MALSKILLIIYYSNTGKTEKMASHIARGAETAGVKAILKKVEDCTINDLAQADGIAVGSPTYYSNIAWQIKRLMDDTILTFYSKGHSLRNKVCSCFTSTGAYDDGKECLRMLELAFGFALKMKIVPGIILESKEIDEGNLSACYEYGQKIAQELT
jgi:NAD(P)H dehydrogenase (quinone)